LKKLQKFECVPSNLSDRLIYGSFGWGCVMKMHPKKVKKLSWFVNEQHIHVVFNFLIPNSDHKIKQTKTRT
jgi:hypothetical protein